MTTEINAYYENSQLAQAAYAVLTEGMTPPQIEAALGFEQQSNYSVTQGNIFAEQYDVIDSQQNTDTGFSATLFQDQAGTYTLAIRGTELTTDFSNDVLLTDIADIGADGIALKQAVDLFNYYQKLITPVGSEAMQLDYYQGVLPPDPGTPYQTILDDGSVPKYRYLKVISSVEGLGEIPESAEINVAGHSLGGHLALILSRLDPDNINQVYTYNAPGFDTGIIGSDDTEWFFDAVRQLQIQQQGTSTVSEDSFPEDKLNNLIIPLDKISDIGEVPAGQINQFGEAQNYFSAHSVVGITDALALYSVLSNLSPDTSFDEITSLFELGASDANSDLEGIINTLGDLLGFGQEAVIGDRETYYQHIQAISAGIYVNPDVISPVLKPEYQNLQIVSVASLSNSAHLNNADGFAYRYALENLNPFAITGDVNLYSQHNQNGELKSDNFSEHYLADRAEMLAVKNQLFAEDTTAEFNADIPADTLFKDTTSGLELRQTVGLSALDIEREQYLFGSDESEQEYELMGGNKNDHIYGGGNDWLVGQGFIEKRAA
ncbi:MAG: hypothetical protein P1P93_05755 [Gammaproteobacteria bacterium]|nr:hypothetical protein [Gammaproteobacteria bacterium]